MMTPAAAVRSRPAVRLPFRMLAALAGVLFISAALGLAYMTWDRGMQTLRVKDVVMLPGMMWFVRLLFYAAFHGTVPSSVNWPFATSGVFRGYCWFAFSFLWLASP
jgi:hypothetical protein